MTESMPAESPILALDSVEATVARVGGKGASLARLAAAGLPVPGGFHITTAAYRLFVAENGLQPAILEAVGRASLLEPATLDSAAAGIQTLFADAQIPEAVAQVVRRAYAGLAPGDGPVAVRSSATAEDLPEMSFAGQQESYLNVRGEAELLAAVKRCWASLWTARAIGYRAANGVPSAEISLAVVVQQLFPADVAGVLFTANPVSGARDQVVINAAWGLGPAVVGGLVTPDTIVAAKASGAVEEQQIADKAVMTVLTADGTTETAVPETTRRQPVLSQRQVAELVRVGAQIEQLYGQAMDVEWAIRDGSLAILQARPITAMPEAVPGPRLEWSLPRPGGRYARASMIELLPDPLSPLFATFGLPLWGRATAQLMASLGVDEATGAYAYTTINDFAYYDIGFLTAQMLKIVPGLLLNAWRLVPLLSSSEARWAAGARPHYAAVVAEWEGVNPEELSAGRLLKGVNDIVHAAASHYLTIQSGILPASYMSEAAFTFVYDKIIKRRADPPALTYLLGYASTPIRAEQSLYDLALWVRSQAPLREYIDRTPSAEIAAACANAETQVEAAGDAWPEFRRRFAAHLDKFGAAIYDLDFAKPTAADDPAPLLEVVKFFLSVEAPNPRERQARSTAERERATRAMLDRLRGPRLALFTRSLASAQRYAPLREDALADVGLGWPVLRRMLRAIGRRLVQAAALADADDIYWLTYPELQDEASALDGKRAPADHREAVLERRRKWENERRATPPVALPPDEGFKFLGFDWSRFAPANTYQGNGASIKGIGTSPGRVAGTARVISGPGEFHQMRPGDILVAKITTPAWTPLFALAGGVVTDVGGPLSHSSIVAREYQIPAVLGTGVATERIRSGQRIVVDGDAGTVTVQSPMGIGQPSGLEQLPLAEKATVGRWPAKRLGLVMAVLLAGAWLWRRSARGSLARS